MFQHGLLAVLALHYIWCVFEGATGGKRCSDLVVDCAYERRGGSGFLCWLWGTASEFVVFVPGAWIALLRRGVLEFDVGSFAVRVCEDLLVETLIDQARGLGFGLWACV